MAPQGVESVNLVGISAVLGLVERGLVPDALVRSGIRALVRDGLRARERSGASDGDLLAELRAAPIAVNTAEANSQHYELPAAFFGLVLGPHRKYSGCYWPTGVRTLADAEAASLRETCAHADLRDGQDVLELGCGWGSLTLWMAAHYPRSRITAVSNSNGQREYIQTQCRERGLSNVRVVTADMNDFAPGAAFDRVVSVEMFEHMRNHEALMRRIAGWLRPDGRLFVHIFVHGRATYLFDGSTSADWMGRHFFTGGMMPSDTLLAEYQDDLVLERQWRQDGTHYQKTADAWLANLDARRGEALEILAGAYGAGEKRRWLVRWRLFFMACAEMFGYADGGEWWVSHYRFKAR